MKVSVVIPVYNVKPYLERCVQSVMRQTYKDLEIILVDDGSTDGSGEMCDDIATRDQRICVIHQENQGLSGARNTGIHHATGEYIIFLDSDDEWLLSDGLGKLIQAGDANDIIVFRCVDIWGDGRHIKRKEYDVENISKLPDSQAIFSYLVQTQQLHIAACTVMVRRMILINNEIYFPSRLISEDLFWSLHLWQHVNTVKVLNLYLYGYYHREGSITASPNIRAYSSYETIFNYWKNQISCNCRNANAIASLLANMWINRGYAYHGLKSNDKNEALIILKRHVDLLQYSFNTKVKLVKKIVDLTGVRSTVNILGVYWYIRTWIKRHVV